LPKNQPVPGGPLIGKVISGIFYVPKEGCRWCDCWVQNTDVSLRLVRPLAPREFWLQLHNAPVGADAFTEST